MFPWIIYSQYSQSSSLSSFSEFCDIYCLCCYYHYQSTSCFPSCYYFRAPFKFVRNRARLVQLFSSYTTILPPSTPWSFQRMVDIPFFFVLCRMLLVLAFCFLYYSTMRFFKAIISILGLYFPMQCISLRIAVCCCGHGVFYFFKIIIYKIHCHVYV